MIIIPLLPFELGKVTVIDDEDFPKVSMYSWFYDRYAYTTIKINGKKVSLRMHRLIINAPEDKDVDHWNGRKLDNRKANLRICTFQENMQNRPEQKDNKLGFKGVYLKSNGKWFAAIKVNGKYIHLGYFDDKIQAAIAYNKAAIKYFGEFAWLNKI